MVNFSAPKDPSYLELTNGILLSESLSRGNQGIALWFMTKYPNFQTKANPTHPNLIKFSIESKAKFVTRYLIEKKIKLSKPETGISLINLAVTS